MARPSATPRCPAEPARISIGRDCMLSSDIIVFCVDVHSLVEIDGTTARQRGSAAECRVERKGLDRKGRPGSFRSRASAVRSIVETIRSWRREIRAQTVPQPFTLPHAPRKRDLRAGQRSSIDAKTKHTSKKRLGAPNIDHANAQPVRANEMNQESLAPEKCNPSAAEKGFINEPGTDHQPVQPAGFAEDLRRDQGLAGVAGADPLVVLRRDQEARDDQLPHLQAGA